MELGMSQKKLADMVDVSMSTVRRWEDAKRKPNFDEIIKLAVILRYKPTYLLGESDEDTLTPDPKVLTRCHLRNLWQRNHPGEECPIDDLEPMTPEIADIVANYDNFDDPLREASKRLIDCMDHEQLRKAYEYLRDQKQLGEFLREKGA
jgi:transcriptional regulator with XRE-family HTH domain